MPSRCASADRRPSSPRDWQCSRRDDGTLPPQRHGTGQSVDVSAVRTGAYLDWKSQIYYAAEGKILQRGSKSGPLVLTCADGFVGFYYRDEEWPAVQRLMGDPRLEDE